MGMQFQTVDDVMVPAVRNLGGIHNYVKLTAVCEDSHVRAYFQRNGIWDFNDFEAYFQAHSETWIYKPDQQAVKLRTEEDSVKAKRAKTSKDVGLGSENPTKVVCLTNLVGAGEVDEDL